MLVVMDGGVKASQGRVCEVRERVRRGRAVCSPSPGAACAAGRPAIHVYGQYSWHGCSNSRLLLNKLYILAKYMYKPQPAEQAVFNHQLHMIVN